MDGASGSEDDETILQALLGGEINGGRFPGDDVREDFRVFGGGELLPCPDSSTPRPKAQSALGSD